MGCLQVLSLCLSHDERLNHKAQTASPLGCVSTGGVVVTCSARHSSSQQASPTSACHWINTVCPYLFVPQTSLSWSWPHSAWAPQGRSSKLQIQVHHSTVETLQWLPIMPRDKSLCAHVPYNVLSLWFPHLSQSPLSPSPRPLPPAYALLQLAHP